MKTLDRLLAELRQRDIQLWLEGDRLRYRAAKDSLTPELLSELKNRKVEIVKFLHKAAESISSQLPPIVPIDREGHLPLSFAQQRLWFLHQLEPDSSSNNMPVVVRFTGSLNVLVLEQSLQALVRRHEVLRTRFPSVNGQATQVIDSDIDLALPVIDLRQISSDQQNAEALRIATEEARRPFDLGKGSILRLLLLRLSDDEHLLVWNMHCMICDGASSDVFYQDLTALYCAFVVGKPSPLPNLEVQYVDFAHWQRQWLKEEVLKPQLNYWKQKLDGTLPAIKLPTDRPRPSIVQTYRGDRCARMLPKSLNESINGLSQKLGGTLFMTLIAAFETLLHRYSQQNDILISFASAGRGQLETEGLLGFFSNTLIQRINFDGNPTFRELFGRVRQASLEAYAHQDVPFEKLVEELPPELSHSRSSLFQVKFALNPPWSNGRGMASVQLPDLTITSLFGYIYHGKTKYDLILVMREQDEGLGMVFDYNADLFDASTIARMLGHLETLLEDVVANPDQKISQLSLLTPAEHQKIVHEWNHSNLTPVPDICIHQLFEAQVEKSPDAIAIDYKDGQLTYRELNSRANQLAHYLQSQGVSTETLVALCIERSPDMLVGILGILKTGGTYIPLDPADPHESQAVKLLNSQASIILTQSSMLPTISDYGAQVVSLDTDWDMFAQYNTDNSSSPVTAENLACVIYTSGSTSEPKGVMITHRGLVNHSQAVSQLYELTCYDRVLQFSNISFDVAVEEIFPTWLNAGTIVLPPSEIYTSITNFLEIINQKMVTVINLPTGFWNKLINGISFLKQPFSEDLRLVIVGGEKVTKSTYQEWQSLIGDFPKWLNAYGPTETTITATIYDPHSTATKIPYDTEIPIGCAITNLQTYVLDQNLQPSPIGVKGELYIGGVGLSRGYLNCPDLTTLHFIPNPFSSDPKERLYKTGDIVRYLTDGNLEFIDRVDFQIKIRDIRVEPNEIETKLEEYPNVKQAIVQCHNALKVNFLVAYLAVQQDKQLEIEDLRNFLQRNLPHYMIPTSFVVLDSLPLNSNGKVDRLALFNLDIAKQRDINLTFQRDEVEQQLANIWEMLLGCHDISIHDNFFELGGNSLLSVRLVAEIEKTFRYNFPLSSFFKIGTISEIAKWIREQSSNNISVDELPSGLSIEDYRALLSHSIGREGKHIGKRGLVIETLPDKMISPQPFIWIGDINFSNKLGLNRPIYTMPANSWTPLQHPEKYIEAVASLLVAELLEIQSEGPYQIGAYCYEGNIAMEMAHQLHAKGLKVSLLTLVDRPGPSKLLRLFLRLDLYFIFIKFHLLNIKDLPFSKKWKYLRERIQYNKIEQNDKICIDKSINELDRVKLEMVPSLDESTKHYQPKKYSGKTLLIRFTKNGLKAGNNDLFYSSLTWIYPYYGWERFLTGEVKFCHLPFHHLELYSSQCAKSLSNLIYENLDMIIKNKNIK